MSDLIAEDGIHRKHRLLLQGLLETTTGLVRIASAYITDTDLLCGVKGRKTRLLTSLSRMDIVSGATSLESLKTLIESGIECRCLSGGPRLHAKTYMFGDKVAVISSANLTGSALDRNIEVGIQLAGPATQELAAWFDAFWTKASSLNVKAISKWQRETADLRREFWNLRKKAASKPMLPNEASPTNHFPGTVRHVLDTAKRFFFCNTDRRHGERTSSGGYFLEDEMHRRGFATAWENFNYPDHMKEVEEGDVILMFAKDVGIVGIGRAKSVCETLRPGHPDRVAGHEHEVTTREWRVPVEWLDWRNDANALHRSGLNGTFLNVTADNHRALRTAVRKHFAGDLE